MPCTLSLLGSLLLETHALHAFTSTFETHASHALTSVTQLMRCMLTLLRAVLVFAHSLSTILSYPPRKNTQPEAQGVTTKGFPNRFLDLTTKANRSRAKPLLPGLCIWDTCPPGHLPSSYKLVVHLLAWHC